MQGKNHPPTPYLATLPTIRCQTFCLQCIKCKTVVGGVHLQTVRTVMGRVQSPQNFGISSILSAQRQCPQNVVCCSPGDMWLVLPIGPHVNPVSQDQTMTVQFLRHRCVVLKFQDQTMTLLCGPENFLGPDNDRLGLNSDRSLCGPR